MMIDRESIKVTTLAGDVVHKKDLPGSSDSMDLLRKMAIEQPESTLQDPGLPMLARRDPSAWRQVVSLARESIFRRVFADLLARATGPSLRRFALDCAERALPLVEMSDPEAAAEARGAVEAGRRFVAGQASVSEIERVRASNRECYLNDFDALFDESPAVAAKIMAFASAKAVVKIVVPECAEDDTVIPFDLPMCGEVWSAERMRQLLSLQNFMRDGLSK